MISVKILTNNKTKDSIQSIFSLNMLKNVTYIIISIYFYKNTKRACK